MQEEYTELRAGERLRKAVQARGQSLKGFAALVGIPYRSMQDYIAGKSKPGFDQLRKIAEAGVDVGFILTGRETGNYLVPHDVDLARSALLSADDELRELVLHYLPSSVDSALQQIPGFTWDHVSAAKIISLWGRAIEIAAVVTEDMGASLADLRGKGVSAMSAAQMITEAVAPRLAASAKSLPD